MILKNATFGNMADRRRNLGRFQRLLDPFNAVRADNFVFAKEFEGVIPGFMRQFHDRERQLDATQRVVALNRNGARFKTYFVGLQRHEPNLNFNRAADFRQTNIGEGIPRPKNGGKRHLGRRVRRFVALDRLNGRRNKVPIKRSGNHLFAGAFIAVYVFGQNYCLQDRFHEIDRIAKKER